MLPVCPKLQMSPHISMKQNSSWALQLNLVLALSAEQTVDGAFAVLGSNTCIKAIPGSSDACLFMI
jgi:hypothetical protein